nr:acyl-CoA dehydrogenase [uncultured Cupriavidus sp.]
MDAHAAPRSLASLIAAYAGGGIPLPTRGQTLARWQLFAKIASTHGAVAIKLFEAHADALAILAERVQATPTTNTRWAVWAAEPPHARVRAESSTQTEVAHLAAAAGLPGPTPLQAAVLSGRKAWCSGADQVTHALLTCHDDEGHALLAIIDMRGPGIKMTMQEWHAIGMANTRSVDVMLDRCPALLIGGHRAYLDRPGFWHGGAGIAACWYGAVLPLAQATRDVAGKHGDPHAAAHLGAIDGDLHAAATLLRETAAWIDAHPNTDAFVPAMRVRTVVEATVLRVLARVGSVLGAGPLCRNSRLAALYADLPVFLRQSHAERDLAALGNKLANAATGYAL